MYSIDLSYKSFIYPWQNISIFQRIALLGKKANKPCIVYIYESPNASTFRYRVYNMCQILNKNQAFCATYVFVDELPFLLNYLDYVDFLVLVRVRWSLKIDALLAKSSARDIKIFFDMDDLVYDVAKIPLIMSSLAVHEDEDSHNSWFSYISRIFLTAKNADGFITTNYFLAEKLSSFFNRKCFVIQNFMNEEQINVSDKIFELKKKLAFEKDAILIGYFSGSPSHNNDFMSISSELYYLMKSDDRIKLRLVGFLDMPPSLYEFYSAKRIECIPLQNYLDLQVKIAECDINIIPLLVNEFTHCKSELKYFEAAIVATESVATPTFVYQKIIQDGKNGYLANQGEWQQKISDLIYKHKDNTLEAARQYVLDNYFGEEVRRKIEGVFSESI